MRKAKRKDDDDDEKEQEKENKNVRENKCEKLMMLIKVFCVYYKTTFSLFSSFFHLFFTPLG